MQSKLILIFLITLLSLAGATVVCLYTKKNEKHGQIMRTLKLTSNTITQGQRLPIDHTGEGKDISPQLAWGDIPTGGKSFAIICDDPDAPSKTWVHWVIFNIPPTVTELAEAIPQEGTLANGALQGRNDFGSLGYRGAMPPKGHGSHRYFFTIYALDMMLDLQPGVSRPELDKAMKGHVLAEGQLMGTYSRE